MGDRYPQLGRGMGKLDPDLWRRMMDALRDFEFYSKSMNMKVRDRERRGSRSTPANSNLVRVFNAGDNDIKMFESCVVTDKVTLMTDALAACDSCDGGTCEYGDCGVWPGGGDGAKVYLDTYNLFKTRTAPVMVVKDGKSATEVKPKPGALLDVLVASGDIVAGEYGWCYVTGMHYAFIWDPRGICNNGGTLTTNGDFYRHEFLYADLPDTGYAGDDDYGQLIFDTRVCSNHPTAADAYIGGVFGFAGEGAWGTGFLGTDAEGEQQFCHLPLVVRPQGRYKVHWVDMTNKLYYGDDDAVEDGEQMAFPISRWITNHLTGGGVDGSAADDGSSRLYPRVRLALVERLPAWTTPTIRALITSYAYWDHTEDEAGEGTNPADKLRFQYEWKYAMGGGSYSSAETEYFHHWRLGNYGRGVNWPEWHNCSCTVDSTVIGPCDECLGQITDDFNEYAGGVHISALDSCFGQKQWAVVAAAGLSCSTTSYGKKAFVDMTMGIDEHGNQLPSFSWQSGVERDC